MIERLLREHDAIRQIASRFEDLLTRDSKIEDLAACRWDLTRTMMLHMAFEDRSVNLPLERDPRPQAAGVAAQFKAELENIHAAFEGHMERWTTAAVAAEWDKYRSISLVQTRSLLDRLHREERELFPFIEGNSEISIGDHEGMRGRNWARSAWAIQDLLAVQ